MNDSLYTYNITTTLSTPEKAPVTCTSSIAGNSKSDNTTLYALLHGHILLLQKELETLELLMKRNHK